MVRRPLTGPVVILSLCYIFSTPKVDLPLLRLAKALLGLLQHLTVWEMHV